MTATADSLAALETGPMSRTQIRAIIVVGLLCALDGFDVLSAAFSAPAIARDWGLGKAAIGTMLSSGLAGMAIGALAVAPFADRFGRRPLILATLVLIATGMLLSAAAPSFGWLVGLRILTGVGIGAMIAVIVSLGAEYSNAPRRALAVALTAIAYPLGGTVGGFVSAGLLANFTWPAVFIAGGIATLSLLPFAFFLVPEPPSFLLTRREPRTLERINAYLHRCGHAPIDTLPPLQVRLRSAYASLFTGGQRAATVSITLVNFLCIMGVYFFLSWTPQLVASSGFSASIGTLVSAVANLAGAIGGILIGIAAARIGVFRAAALAMAGFGISVAIFGAVPAILTWLFATAIVAGFFQIATMSGVYGIMATTFPPAIRSTGTGFVTGIGRIGAAIAPALAGFMLSEGMSRATVCLVFGALGLAAAAITVGYLARASSPLNA